VSRRLLLLSNSTQHGGRYLDHAWDAVARHFAGVREIVFVPFALRDQAEYTEKARARFAQGGIGLRALPLDASAAAVLQDAEGVFVGGGNTFRLLGALQRTSALIALRDRAVGGMPYLGASAGTNIAAPTIRTTNDMPIVQPATFDALALVPFQINPHYMDAEPGSTHMGETREQRLREYLEENERPVLGLREGAWLQVQGNTGTLAGTRPARLFRRGTDPEELAPGADLSFLL
jgi:dipeptidase E